MNIDTYEVSFELSEPFRPVEQLLAVLPSDSVHALPECCQHLMLSPDSPIADIYSKDIPLDPNGKVLPWLWVVLLPFIDERRIREVMKLCESELTPDEKRRNSFGTSVMFFHKDHRLGVNAEAHFEKFISTSHLDEPYYFDSIEVGDGICGKLILRDDLSKEYGINQVIRAPARPLRAFQDITCNRVFCFEYHFPEEQAHLSSLLPNVDLGPNILSDYDGIIRRPKLNKGKFNIADIAERMREERRGTQQPYHRIVMAGIGFPFHGSQRSEYQSYSQNSEGSFTENQPAYSMNFSFQQSHDHHQYRPRHTFRERVGESESYRRDIHESRSQRDSRALHHSHSHGRYSNSPNFSNSYENFNGFRFSRDDIPERSTADPARNMDSYSRAPSVDRINPQNNLIPTPSFSSSGSIHNIREQLCHPRPNHLSGQTHFSSRDPRMRNK